MDKEVIQAQIEGYNKGLEHLRKQLQQAQEMTGALRAAILKQEGGIEVLISLLEEEEGPQEPESAPEELLEEGIVEAA